jgi:hypothetical protein
MSTQQRHGVPFRLERLRRRFERWREARRSRSRIPEGLWAAAVKMAGTTGLHQTAKVLRLNYYALKKRAEQQPPAVDPPEKTAATFLELPFPVDQGPPVPCAGSHAVPAEAGGCTIEWENAAGAKMRVHLKGTELPNLAALSRSFWNPGP